MNKTAIKNFAVSARIKLMDTVKQKAYELGITKAEIKEPEVYEDGFRVNEKFFKKYEIKQREKLLEKIKEKSYDQIIEEVAYTWFNRFIAIRFMEVNEYLPTGVRVLSSIEQGKVEPDAVTEVLSIVDDLGLDLELVYQLQDENDTEDLFKYILIKQCNKLGEIMPMVFEQIEDYTELLLPDNLLVEGSVIQDLVLMIEEDNWKDQVEIIGWLYQYYISEKKDEVFADLKKNKKITKENIPAATQLFTPKWIVKYMVENSLGKLWLESHPDEELRQKWKYYLEEAEQEPEVLEELKEIKNKELSPEDIKVLDPCMGSGHILVYAFDVLYNIYQNAGYSDREIPQLILEKNLYGLDIDDRAAQLAYFAVMMKARSYSRKIFYKHLKLNLCSIQESNRIPREAVDYLVTPNGLEMEKVVQREAVEYLVNIFQDAKEYGSILEVEPINLEALEERLMQLENGEVLDLFEEQYREILLENMPSLIKQAKIMSEKYDVAVTNPPYMGSKGMNKKLSDYLKKNYPDSKSDLFAVFIERINNFTKVYGLNASINQHSWMFLDSYKKIRSKILSNFTIVSMLHLGPRAFEEISGEVVQSTTYILRKYSEPIDYKSTFFRLVEYRNAQEKKDAYLNKINSFVINQKEFQLIEGSTIIYWATKNVRELFFNYKGIGQNTSIKHGMSTGNNDRMLRRWYEVNICNIAFNCKSVQEFEETKRKFAPFNKGGSYRKWYGNNQYVVAYDFKSRELMSSFPGHRHDNKDYYFRKGVTWSRISTGLFSARYSPEGFIFADAGCTLFTDSDNLKMYLVLLNSKVANFILTFLSPTMTYEVGQLKKIPDKLCNSTDLKLEELEELIDRCIQLSKNDWDAYEVSWEFRKHPLILHRGSGTLISQAFFNWEESTLKNIEELVTNEEKINHNFIEMYGLSNEIAAKVSKSEISIKKADKQREIKSFISYAVGCMVGRYSLDKEGLVCAGGHFDESEYPTFKATKDNILTITDDDYFEDDIVSRFIEFVSTTFGKETLEENLNFIAESLTKKTNETSRQRIRRYFLKEFYTDHLQIYQKSPIYWLFDSGKNDGFKVLIYMHRYDISMVAKIRTDYLHTLQRKYEAEISRLDIILDSPISNQEKTKIRKQKEKIQKQLIECQQYDQVIAHVANQKVHIELDDGVKMNYAKFQNVEIPQGEGKKPLKANLLSKI